MTGLISLHNSTTPAGNISLYGVDAHLFGQRAHFNKRAGLLTLSLTNDSTALQLFSVAFWAVNPLEPQASQVTYIQALDPRATTLAEMTDTGLDRRAPLLVMDFEQREIGQSSPFPGSSNTLSVTFSVSSQLTTNSTSPSHMQVLEIKGLVTSSTADSDDFSAYTRYHTPIHSAVWRSGIGALYLRLNDTLLSQTPYMFSFVIQNSISGQSSVVPSIAVGQLSANDGGVVFSSQSLLAAVEMNGANGTAAPLRVFANFTVVQLGQSSASSSANNTLTLTLASKGGLTFDSSILLTLRGLTGSHTPSGIVIVTSMDASNDLADWNRERGTLIFSLNITLAASQPLVLSFTLKNPRTTQSSPRVSLWISQISPMWNPLTSGLNLEAPLVVAGFVTATLSQTTASQGATNTLRLEISLQTLMPAGSVILISGLTGSATVDSLDIVLSILQFNNTLTAISPFKSTAQWNQTKGQLRMELLLPSESSIMYAIVWNVTNPFAYQPTPNNIRMWSEGPVTIAETSVQTATGSASPMLVNGFQTAYLSQDQVSVSTYNKLTLTLMTQAAEIKAKTLVTLSGLVGAMPDGCRGLATCEFNIELSPPNEIFRTVALWYAAAANTPAHIVLRLVEDSLPDVEYSFIFEVLNGGNAQMSPDISISACCESVIVPVAVDRGSKNTAPLLIAGSVIANISQSSAGQGMLNNLTLDLSFTVRLGPTDPATYIEISDLVGSKTASSTSANPFEVQCSGNKLNRPQWKATDTRGILTLSIGNDYILAGEVVTCSFTLRNPEFPQVAAQARVQLHGAIAGESYLMTPPALIHRAPLFVYGWTHASILQRTPSAGEINTLTVSLESLGSLPAAYSVTISGLFNTRTSSTLQLPLVRNESVSPSPFAATGVWTQESGDLIVYLSSPLRSAQFSFDLRNPLQGRDGLDVQVHIEGLLVKRIMQSGLGNSAAMLVAGLLLRSIGQSNPGTLYFVQTYENVCVHICMARVLKYICIWVYILRKHVLETRFT